MAAGELHKAGASDFAAGSVPAWASDFQLRRESDGRLFFVGKRDGCQIWIQPEGWSKMTLRDEAQSGDAAGTPNYGLQMGQLQAHAGALETNDASFGKLFAGASGSTADQCPMPNSAPTGGPEGYTTPALILAGGIVAAVILARFKRTP